MLVCTQMHIWSYLELYGAIYSYLRLSATICNYLDKPTVPQLSSYATLTYYTILTILTNFWDLYHMVVCAKMPI